MRSHSPQSHEPNPDRLNAAHQIADEGADNTKSRLIEDLANTPEEMTAERFQLLRNALHEERVRILTQGLQKMITHRDKLRTRMAQASEAEQHVMREKLNAFMSLIDSDKRNLNSALRDWQDCPPSDKNRI